MGYISSFIINPFFPWSQLEIMRGFTRWGSFLQSDIILTVRVFQFLQWCGWGIYSSGVWWCIMGIWFLTIQEIVVISKFRNQTQRNSIIPQQDRYLSHKTAETQWFRMLWTKCPVTKNHAPEEQIPISSVSMVLCMQLTSL